MANGQFIFIARDCYDAVGGHAHIQGEILDDVALARQCKEHDRILHMVYGREPVSDVSLTLGAMGRVDKESICRTPLQSGLGHCGMYRPLCHSSPPLPPFQ